MKLQALQASISGIYQQSSQWSFSKVFKRALTVSMVALAAINAQSSHSFWHKDRLKIEDCFSSNCPDIDQSQVHPREKAAAEAIYEAEHPIKSKFTSPKWSQIQDNLRFRFDNPNERVLYVSTEFDYNGAQNPRYNSNILRQLAKLNFKYHVSNGYEEMCELIGRTEDITYLFISGLGNQREMIFSADINADSRSGDSVIVPRNRISAETDFRCLSNLRPDGRIFFITCGVGKSENGRLYSNFAQKVADVAKRTVIATDGMVFANDISFLSDDKMAHYPKNSGYKKVADLLGLYEAELFENSFTTYRPVFSRCFPEIIENNLHVRDIQTEEVIKADLVSRNLLQPEDQIRTLQICEDDPREVVLFFSASYDKEGKLTPSLNPRFFGDLADRFNLRHHVVYSLNGICEEIENISRIKEVSKVIIHADVDSTHGMVISLDQNQEENLINSSNDFTCLSRVKKDGAIILLGDSLGQKVDKKSNSIAQRIANDSKRKVVAAVCPFFFGSIYIKSFDPLTLDALAIFKMFNLACSEKHLFKTFNPFN